MPLLHQDNSRCGSGSTENRRSIAEFLGLDARLGEPATTPAVHHRNNDCGGDNEWRWEEPGSPEAAQTPRGLVPSTCFPPRHPNAFTSFSESAQPGMLWSEESTSGRGITDLVASLKALAMPSSSVAARAGRDDALWHGERRPPSDRTSLIPRRASFCGVVSSGRNGAEVLRWGGKLPPRCSDPSGGFSAKVFLGGLPWDITEHALMHTLKHFQPVRVEWPGRECSSSGGGGGGGGGAPRGYAYVTFESERRVRALLAASRRDGHDWFYRIGSRKMRSKEVQVIPWALSDSNWVVGGSVRLEPARTVFVGALHGMLSASALATIMNDLFSGVVYAGIDTDKYKYPIGSGRVTFNNVRSYVRAISAAYVEIHTDKFTKKVQVNPYLEDSMCSVCNLQQGPYFCREPTCFGYFCRSCWSWQHGGASAGPPGSLGAGPAGAALGVAGGAAHVPLTRNSTRHEPPHAEPQDHHHANIFNGMFPHPNDGTPSPATSGTSATSGSSDTCDVADTSQTTWLH